jgi:hypothetical protein
VHEIDSLEIYPTDRSDTVIGEWSVKGHVIPNGNAYNMAYATFVTVRDGSVVQLPPAGGAAVGRALEWEFCLAVGSEDAAGRDGSHRAKASAPRARCVAMASASPTSERQTLVPGM